MKPLRLIMEAFGSYGQKTEIDFSEATQNLFLVTGDTGAGKTTIFDAIVFALYGEASSSNNKKSGQELQSQFASYRVKPYVQLTFTDGYGENEQEYTVIRYLRHLSLKKDGTFKMKNGAPAVEKETVSLTLPDGEEFTEGLKETNQKLEEIIGLTKEQFMQVGMIAQGEFMETLRAKSNDKKLIFRKLFNTQIFNRILEELGDRCKAKRTDIARIKTACQTEISHISVPEDYDKADRILTLQEEIIKKKDFSIVTLENIIEELAEMCHWLSSENEMREKAFEEASQAKDAAALAYQMGETLHRYYEQLDEAKSILEECKKEEAEIKKAQRRIVDIEDAYEIKAKCLTFKEAEKRWNETKDNLNKQVELVPSLNAAFHQAQEKASVLEKEKTAELERFSKVKTKVEKAQGVFAQIDEAKKQLEIHEKSLKNAEKAKNTAEKAYKDLEEAEKSLKKEKVELKDAPATWERFEAKKKIYQDLGNDYKELVELARSIEEKEKNHKEAANVYLKLKEDYEKINQLYVEKQGIYFDAQAGILAKNLSPGQPCPVCGSLEHPMPHALSSEHEEITKELLDEMAGQVQTANEAMQTKSILAATTKSSLDESKLIYGKSLLALTEKIRENELTKKEILTISDCQELLRAWGTTLSKEKESAEKKKDRFDIIEKELESLDEKKPIARETMDANATALQQREQEYSASQSVLHTLGQNLDYPTLEDATGALNQAEEAKNEMEKAYHLADQSLKDAKTKKEQCETLIKSYEEQIPKQEKEKEEYFLAYRAIMEEKKFSEWEWMEMTRIFPKNTTEELREKVKEHQEKKAKAEGQMETAREGIGEHTRPILSELLVKKESTENTFKTLRDSLSILSNQAKEDQKVYDSLTAKQKERESVLQEYGRLDLLHQRLAGKISGARMDIETFVQRYYLERILDSANLRFQEMSGGQFELRMYDLEKAGEGGNKGLDLMVYSTVTNKEREIRTLSGGESFMAALSLALGMADQIQENAASINLDVMFIDEGFGSLDEHSRNQAVKVLQQMAGGSKMIGIISHVTELKQEMENQLIVSKDENGSHCRWEIS
ncbi:MAG: SMC family ATPase [Eubacteriales bacterium]|nr:SMC family ATPase [Eubacteriales bacterium]